MLSELSAICYDYRYSRFFEFFEFESLRANFLNIDGNIYTKNL